MHSTSVLTLTDWSFIVAAVAVIVAAGFSYLSVREARRANSIPALVEFFREFRDYEPDRRYVIRELHTQIPSKGISGLPDSVRGHAITICHYLDQLGFLVETKLVEVEHVAGLMGDSILQCWKALKPFIEGERAGRNRDYAAYFEALVARIWKIDPKAARGRLPKVEADMQIPAPFNPETP